MIVDAGESGTHEESKEGMIRIAPTSASSGLAAADPRLCARMFLVILTQHGSFVSTNSMVFQDTYAGACT